MRQAFLLGLPVPDAQAMHDGAPMLLIADALAPVLVVIALGYWLRRIRFFPDAFWPGLDKFNYWLLLPALLFNNLAQAQLGNLPGGQVLLAVWSALWLCAVVLWLLRRLLAHNDQGFTSVVQGALRNNSTIALVVVPALFGAQFGALTAILVALTIPMANVICIILLTRYGMRAPLRPWPIVKALLTNPFIIASLLGLGWNMLGLRLTPGLALTLGAFAAAALVCGLVSVGAGLDFASLRVGGRTVIGGMLGKFLVLPALMAVCCAVFQLPREIAAAMVFFQSVPTSPASYVLARQMHGDAPAMAAILTAQSLAALAAMPAMFWLLGGS